MVSHSDGVAIRASLQHPSETSGIYPPRLPLCLVMTPEPDLSDLIARCQADARAEATDAAGKVDPLKEALAFRRLIVEAASQD